MPETNGCASTSWIDGRRSGLMERRASSRLTALSLRWAGVFLYQPRMVATDDLPCSCDLTSFW
eukprot:4359152-Prymnesium_polylepis.1